DDRRMYFILDFFDRYCPQYSYVLAKFYKSTFPFMCFLATVHVHQIFYFTQHTHFQLRMLQKYLENISNVTLDVEEEELFYNLEYQTEVRRRLLFCICRLQDCLK